MIVRSFSVCQVYPDAYQELLYFWQINIKKQPLFRNNLEILKILGYKNDFSGIKPQISDIRQFIYWLCALMVNKLYTAPTPGSVFFYPGD